MASANTTPGQASGRGLALCLSGGGHRATLFGLGVLMYLVDAGVNADVTSISSVSGSSFTNGFVGQALDFRKTDGAEFRKSVASPLATQIAQKGTLFAPGLTKLYMVALILGLALVALLPTRITNLWYLQVFWFVFLLLAWGWLLSLRGAVCASALEKTLFSPSGLPTRLSDLKKTGLDHVICTTELQSSEQVFFSGDFVFSYQFGCGQPANLSLARVVQASAAVPGAFPPVFLSALPHGFTGTTTARKKLIMTDGGVYDNLGDQWAWGLDSRLQLWPQLAGNRQPPTQLVVVNASARVAWSPFRRIIVPIVSELGLFMRVNDVMYVNTTNIRRRDIVDGYDPYLGQHGSRLPSALIQISQSPFLVADAFLKSDTPAADRAKAVLAMLGDTRDEWFRIASENSTVATTLAKLGVETSARLIYHGYVVAMCNLFVIFGEEFPLLPTEVSLDRFRELIANA